MRISHIETVPFYEDIWAIPLKAKPSIKRGVCTIFPNPDRNNYIIRTENGRDAIEFNFKNSQDKVNIDIHFSRRTAHICNVKLVEDGKFLFDLYVFAGGVEDLGEVTIFVPDEDKFKKIWDKKLDDLHNNMAKDCMINLNGDEYFIMQGDYGRPNASEVDDESEEQQENFFGAFSILCYISRKCYAIKIQQKSLSSTGIDKYLTVTGISPLRTKQQAGNYHLVKASLIFSDQKQAATEYNRKKLEEMVEKSGSYLKAWQEYTEERGNRILEQARKFGARHYTDYYRIERNVKLYFKEPIAEIPSEVEELAIYDSNEPYPIFLKDKTCSFHEYCEKKILARADLYKDNEKWKKKFEEKVIYGVLVHFGENCVEIRISDENKGEIPAKGYVVMSMNGEEIQIKRQSEAWDAVAHGLAGISHLGNILEGSFNFMPTAVSQPKVHISSRMCEKIFKKPPTDRQLEAIEMCLRTPDIALVQGPPGTGKTTVIAAVLEMLNEAQDKRGSSAGRVLVTSYQHDAVENMIDRIRINSLPTWKYGKRHGDVNSYNEHIKKWCSGVEERVAAFNPNIQISREEEQFCAYVAEYVYSPLPDNKKRLLEYITQHLPITEDLATRAQGLLSAEPERESHNRPDLLRMIHAIRTTDTAYADDGAKRIEELYFALEERFEANKVWQQLLCDLLKGAQPNAKQLSELARLKISLLEEFSNKPPYISSDVNEDVVALCNDVTKFLEIQRGKRDKKEQIIADWIGALKSGPEAFARAIKECDFVYSATSQQSIGADIQKQKRAIEGAKTPYTMLYDTVIVDEAARATPPDMLIPMCKAVRRIILVGDHRQLPQLVEDDLCDRIYKKANGQDRPLDSDLLSSYGSAYKLSLFELLFKKLKELESKDGIKRTITLDEQFRTHPVLGQFCSEHFYDAHGEGYKSPRQASEFEHQLPEIAGKAAVWIDVPKECGKEERLNTKSRKRECEAKCIVEYFMNFVRHQHDVAHEKKLSIGIITYYGAQRDLITSKIKLYESELTGINYRVGTVDAFQGMEFDVVFLSVVRTEPDRDGSVSFLTPNRLCVSMSRQKKVLIVVGCSDFVKSFNTHEMQTLSAFYDLCEQNKYGAIIPWKK